MKNTAKTTALGLSVSMLLAACGSQAASAQTAVSQTETQQPQTTVTTTAESSENRYVAPEQGTPLDNGETKIKEGGSYLLSGNYSALTIDTEDKVTLIFNGCSITAEDTPAIQVKNAEEVTVCLVPGTSNTLTDGTSGDEEASACFYSAADLWFCGEGSLTVNGNFNDGIQTADDLTIAGGSITVTAVDDCLIGRDSVTVGGGSLTLSGGGHGIKSTNEEKGEILLSGGSYAIEVSGDALHSVGNLTLDGGEYQITAEDDAVHADNVLTVNGGNVQIASCYEGLEGKQVILNGGSVELTATDDGINAANDASGQGFGGFGSSESMTAEQILACDSYIHITGGSYVINAEGDGIDSNGAVLMEGGTVTVFGPTNGGNGALDYDKAFLMNGGTLIAIGASGMAESPSADSLQNVLVAGGSFAAGDEIVLTDESGVRLVSFTNRKTAQNLVISTPDLVTGKTVTLTVNSTELGTAELTEGTTTIGDVSSFGGFGGGQRGGFDPGRLPEGFDPSQAPEDIDPSQMPQNFGKGQRQKGADFGNSAPADSGA